MNKRDKHYDAWGNPVLPHMAMIAYYENNHNALYMVKNYMPHRFIVIPNVEIRINLHDLSNIYVWRLFPGGSSVRLYDGSKRRVEALRRLYRNKRGWTTYTDNSSFVVFRREGTVIPDPKRRYYPSIPA